MSHSHYWIIRNHYERLKGHERDAFLSDFGLLFEDYVREIFKNTLNESEFKKIPEGKEKSADWYLNLDGIEFLIEQKASLAPLRIKQPKPDLKSAKQYIVDTWGEAVRQLKSSEEKERLKTPIKIILVYEEYFISESLELLFRFDDTLKNDGKYWLVNINEFEMLMLIYRQDKEMFKKIIVEKDRLEQEKSNIGRSLSQIMMRNGITQNEYLDTMGVSKTMDCVIDDLKREN